MTAITQDVPDRPVEPSITAGELTVTLVVNGERRTVTCEPRTTLVDALRDHLGLTGTHVGCEHGACGACTVLLDGIAVRACLLFAVQVVDREITTIEGLAPDGELHPVQAAFASEHGLQCGFCTPGMVMSICSALAIDPGADDDALRSAVAGNLCRCTGYTNIVRAARVAADQMNP